MKKKVEVIFEANNLSDVRNKINAFETLYETTPDVFVEGEVLSKKQSDGSYNLDIEGAIIFNLRLGWTEVKSVRHKYFSAKYDGELDTKLMPTNQKLVDKVYPYRNGLKYSEHMPDYDEKIQAEATNWKLEARVEL